MQVTSRVGGAWLQRLNNHPSTSVTFSFNVKLRPYAQVVKPINMTREIYVTRIVPVGGLFAVSLWLSNTAYLYLSVAFIQMVKAGG